MLGYVPYFGRARIQHVHILVLNENSSGVLREEMREGGREGGREREGRDTDHLQGGGLGMRLATCNQENDSPVTPHLGLFIGGDDLGSTVHRGIVVLRLAYRDACH